MAFLEELDRQDRGQTSENVEIVPFDNVSRGRGHDHGPKIPRDLSCLTDSHLSHVTLLLAPSLRDAAK